MAQANIILANTTRTIYRARHNEINQALATFFSGPTAPANPIAHQPWLDTSQSPPLLRRRNAANSAWDVATPLPPTLTEAQATDAASTVPGIVTGERLAQAAAAFSPPPTGDVLRDLASPVSLVDLAGFNVIRFEALIASIQAGGAYNFDARLSQNNGATWGAWTSMFTYAGGSSQYIAQGFISLKTGMFVGHSQRTDVASSAIARSASLGMQNANALEVRRQVGSGQTILLPFGG